MRQEEFNNIINLLETDVMFGVSVYDLSNGIKIIELNKTKEQIVEKYESVANFFNGLFSNGVTKVGIQPLKKNGQSKGKQNWVKHNKHNYLEVSLLPSEKSPEVQSIPVQPFQSNVPVNYGMNDFGLGNPGLAGVIGLHVKASNSDKLELENQFLKKRVEDLEKINRDYELREVREEKEIEKMKYKSEANNKTLETVSPLLAPFLEKIAGAIAPGQSGSNIPISQGLASPDLSPQKRSLIDVISNCDEFTAQLLAFIYDGMATNNTFSNELSELLKKHNIIQ